MRRFSENKKLSDFARTQRLVTFDRYGRIYFPAFVRALYRGYHFSIQFEGGKIVLDPVKVDDAAILEEEVRKCE